MRRIEQFALSSLLAGGCLAPPMEVVGANKPPMIEVPVATPTPDSEFLKETQEIQMKASHEEPVEQTVSALRLLKQKSETHYRIFIKYLGVSILELSDSGEEATEIFLGDPPPRVHISASTRAAGIIWYAGALVHESCHAMKFFDYQERFPGKPVPGDVFTGPKREQECGRVGYDALELLGASQDMLEYVKTGYGL